MARRYLGGAPSSDGRATGSQVLPPCGPDAHPRDHDAVGPLRRLDAPLLWVLAGEDREAPIDSTRRALLALAKEGRAIDVYLFPDTDHGMVDFTTGADGSRQAMRITEGYLRLLGDWIHGRARGPYGRAEKLKPS